MPIPIRKISLKKLFEVYYNMEGRVTYHLGGKAASMDCDSHEIHSIDCSGFVRYAGYKASDGHFDMPDGSQVQLDWAEIHLRRLTMYSNVQYAKDDDSRLFIAFMKPHFGHPGHVWFVYKGMTYESHGGVGVSSRPWDTLVLKRGAYAAYEIETLP